MQGRLLEQAFYADLRVAPDPLANDGVARSDLSGDLPVGHAFRRQENDTRPQHVMGGPAGVLHHRDQGIPSLGANLQATLQER